MDHVAADYVRLVLAVGQHDPDYVDAYYGPEDWKPAPGDEPKSIDRLSDETARLLDGISAEPPAADVMDVLRRDYLLGQLRAVHARLQMLAGERFTFDEESRALYDAVAPTHGEEYFARTLADLDARLPGTGPLPERHEAFKRQFVISPDRLDRVFGAAIEACRARTRAHLALPAGAGFTVEYVTASRGPGT